MRRYFRLHTTKSDVNSRARRIVEQGGYGVGDYPPVGIGVYIYVYRKTAVLIISSDTYVVSCVWRFGV